MSEHGVTTTGSVLDRIVADARAPLELQKRNVPAEKLEDRVAERSAPWPLDEAIRSPRGNVPASAAVQIVAEVKKASPSRGVLAEHLDAVSIAESYAQGGAAGISVVTERNHFLGHIDWLAQVRDALEASMPDTRPSLLRKDFLFDPYQVAEAAAYGADNILLIVAMLEDTLLTDLLAEARSLGLGALVEVHNEAEAARAVQAGATLFGINNRDLHTFDVDLGTTERIRPLLPRDAVVIGESGVHTKADVERLQNAGVRAVLVGEAFMTAPDVAVKMDELRL